MHRRSSAKFGQQQHFVCIRGLPEWDCEVCGMELAWSGVGGLRGLLVIEEEDKDGNTHESLRPNADPALETRMAW